ncbi:hypothetical protein K438DRAFT_1781440 [Mycena galopus ATCC 62051]|nr:hypothetical protein K438DRAFT_1781440 [Mycena galopus ATCC 62051]
MALKTFLTEIQPLQWDVVGSCAKRGFLAADASFLSRPRRPKTAHSFAKLFRKPNLLTFLPFIRELVFAQKIVKHPGLVPIFPKLVAHLPSTIYLGCGCTPGAKWPSASPKPPATLRSLDLNFGPLGVFLHWIHVSNLAISGLALFFTYTGWARVPSEPEAYYDLTQYIYSLGASLASVLRSRGLIRVLSIQCACDKAISLLGAMHLPPTLKHFTMAIYSANKEMYRGGTGIYACSPSAGGTVDFVCRYQFPLEKETFKERMCVRWGGLVLETQSLDMHSNWFQLSWTGVGPEM